VTRVEETRPAVAGVGGDAEPTVARVGGVVEPTAAGVGGDASSRWHGPAWAGAWVAGGG
jgi:hypothetical protein